MVKNQILKKKPRILLVPNIPNWAFDDIANNIIKHLKYYYHFDKKYVTESFSQKEFANYDLIHVFESYDLTKFEQVPRKKLTTSIHSVYEIKLKGKKYYNSINKRVVALSVVSKELMNKSKKFHQDLFLIPNGVDSDYFKPSKNKITKTFTIGWTGSCDNFKGKKKDIKGYYTFLVPLKNSKKFNCIYFKKEDKIRSKKEMIDEFYNKIDCYLCVSKSEGHPMPVLEAASCGIPIVSTKVGIVPELIKDGYNGFIVRRWLFHIKKKLNQIQYNKQLRIKMGERNRTEILKHWTWKEKSKAYKDFFDFALNKK